MPTRNVKLTDHFDRFLEEQVEVGRYRDVSEVMRAGLRLLEQQTREESEKLALLSTLASNAFQQIDQGRGIEVRGDRPLSAYVARVGRRAGKATKRGSSSR